MRHKNCLTLIALGFLGLSMLTQKSIAQERPKSNMGCTVIAEGRPAVFIEYERTDKDGKKVWLHLYNNLTCGIIVETDDCPGNSAELFKAKEVKNSYGSGTRYVLDAPTEGATCAVAYNYQDRQSKKAPEPANYSESRDYIRTLTMPPGRSVRFSVDAEYLRRGFDISVPFSYEWDLDALIGVGPAEHQLFFYNSQLPDGAIKRLAETENKRPGGDH
jgi:hypothetical protein